MGIHERMAKAAASKFGNSLLYKACKKALDNNEIKFTHSQKRVLSKYVLEGTLNGLHLEGEKFEEYMADLNFIGSKTKEFKVKYEVCRRKTDSSAK